MFWREKYKKKYYHYTEMKMKNNYLFPVCNYDTQLKMKETYI